MIDVDLCGGPGGWEQGIKALGVRPVGIEWDFDACKTAVAAGHLRIQADISRYPLDHLRGLIRLLITSTPCTTFSAAGNGMGREVMGILARGITDTFAGRNVVGRCRNEAARAIKPYAATTRTFKPYRKGMPARVVCVPKAERAAWVRRQAFVSCLVLEIARWVRDCEPEAVCCENVPGVRPVFEVIAHEMRRLGYSVIVRELNAADFGVPQTRKRVFLMASRVRTVSDPEPTHTANPAADLFGAGLPKHVSMATALGWGATERPMPTVTAGGTASGGAEPIARGGRAAIEREREREREELGSLGFRLHRGAGMNERHGERRNTPVDEPAPTITSKARTATWVVTHD